MKEMSVGELKQYFENVIALETQILTAERAMDTIRKESHSAEELQKRKSPDLKIVKPPQKPELAEFYGECIDGVAYIPEPKKPNGAIMPVGVFIVLLILFALTIINFFRIGQTIGAVIESILLLGMSISFVRQKKIVESYKKSLSDCIENNQKYKKLYEKEKARRIKEIENTHRIEMTKYNTAVAETKKEHNELVALNDVKVKNIKDIAAQAIKKINDKYWSLKVTLDKLYAVDIIFPKYRNIFAVCSLYEYLASGRCSTLEGHEGAYNIYESELRQELILIKLDVVISQLENIKQNQYMLYKEMKEMKSILYNISCQMKEMLKKTDTIIDNTNIIASNTQQIAECSAVIAMYTQMTAKNTEAIKYLSLIG